MSEWIKCDKCNKITKADSSGDRRYKIKVDGLDGCSIFHLCEGCLRSFYLDFLEWEWDDDESQYKPEEMKSATEASDIDDLLTDIEQRIFLKAMQREREVCRAVDDTYAEHAIGSNVTLVKVCNSIERKVKKIWE